MKQVINSKADQNQSYITQRFLIYTFFHKLFFVSAIWLYFYRIYISDQQTGILDSIAFAICLIAEVPSGLLADRIGRAKIVRIGQLLAGTGMFIQGMGAGFYDFLVGQTILMIGTAFISGADEALFFSELKLDQDSPTWRALRMKAEQVSLIALLTATAIGGLTYNINPRLPWFLTAIAFIFSSFIIAGIKDTRDLTRSEDRIHRFKSWLSDLKLSILEILSAKLFLYVPIIICLQGLYYASGWGMLRLILLDRFKFSPFNGALVITACGLFTILILSSFQRFCNKIGLKAVITGISVSAILSLVLSIFDIGHFGFFVILVLYSGENILYPYLSEEINKNAREDLRATIISLVSFLRSAPYLVLAPVIGYLNFHQMLHYFLIAWAVLIAGSLIFYLNIAKTKLVNQ